MDAAYSSARESSVRCNSPSLHTPALFIMWVFSFFEKVKIAAIAAVAQRLGAGKAQLSVHRRPRYPLAEQGAQLRAAVFHAGRVPVKYISKSSKYTL